MSQREYPKTTWVNYFCESIFPHLSQHPLAQPKSDRFGQEFLSPLDSKKNPHGKSLGKETAVWHSLLLSLWLHFSLAK